MKRSFQAIVVGGGHNGLVCASYLAKQGKRVAVFESRKVLGGASVTEELIPGYKFSRGAYLGGLLRPTIIKELKLDQYGLEFFPRQHSSFTPMLNEDYLLMMYPESFFRDVTIFILLGSFSVNLIAFLISKKLIN